MDGAAVHRRRGVQPDAGVAVLAVVVGEERSAERSGVRAQSGTQSTCVLQISNRRGSRAERGDHLAYDTYGHALAAIPL